MNFPMGFILDGALSKRHLKMVLQNKIVERCVEKLPQRKRNPSKCRSEQLSGIIYSFVHMPANLNEHIFQTDICSQVNFKPSLLNRQFLFFFCFVEQRQARCQRKVRVTQDERGTTETSKFRLLKGGEGGGKRQQQKQRIRYVLTCSQGGVAESKKHSMIASTLRFRETQDMKANTPSFRSGCKKLLRKSTSS